MPEQSIETGLTRSRLKSLSVIRVKPTPVTIPLPRSFLEAPLINPPSPRRGDTPRFESKAPMPDSNNNTTTPMGYYPLRPLFPSGEILASPAVIEIGIEINRLLHRHLAGLWREDLSLEDSQSNEMALARGEAILSQYHVASPDGQINNVVIMTESDRSYTVIFILGEPGFPSVEA